MSHSVILSDFVERVLNFIRIVRAYCLADLVDIEVNVIHV
jgi:hypothetical protein